MADRESLIYDWNNVGNPPGFTGKRIYLNDETLRDGLQSPTACNPSIDDKIELLRLMDALGIRMADIGLPGAGPRAHADVLALAQEIVGSKLDIRPNCAARTVIADIDPIIDVSQKAGIAIEAGTFIGSSMIRQYVEKWTLDDLLRRTEEAVGYVVGHGLPCAFVTEDTTRAFPETVRRLYTAAIEAGARQIVLTDTVGHATPDGARALVQFALQHIVGPSGADVLVAWHGHNDRGLSVANALEALRAGADVVHGCALGIGERVGNAPMDQLLVNLKLLGVIDNDLVRLKDYCETAARACGVAIPPGYPVFGRDAFRTATGVHAAAIIKALESGERELANMVYSGVPAHLFGLGQVIEIGPMSGRSNITFWLRQHGIEASGDRIDVIYRKAKQADKLLTEAEILEAISGISA